MPAPLAGHIADIIRQRHSGWTTAAWLALIVLLPIVGSVIL